MVGETINNYKVIEKIGIVGMGEMYRADCIKGEKEWKRKDGAGFF